MCQFENGVNVSDVLHFSLNLFYPPKAEKAENLPGAKAYLYILMFIHQHPYPPILLPEATRLIVGTLPPPRFTQGLLKPGDVDFCYGSRDGLLWPILDRIFDLGLEYEDSERAVSQRLDFLKSRKIGICDIVERARRERIDASDLGMRELELRDLLGVLRDHPRIETLLFTGGNSQNGPEFLFRRLLREEGLRLEPVSDEVPRIHRFTLADPSGAPRELRTVSLTAPSGSANRSIGSLPEYKARKAKDPSYTVMDFRVEQYRRFFRQERFQGFKGDAPFISARSLTSDCHSIIPPGKSRKREIKDFQSPVGIRAGLSPK